MSKEHFVSKSDTDINIKDLWQTPSNIFDALNNEFDFNIDICASEENRLCNHSFNEEYSALEHEWNDPYNGMANAKISSAFINPPYSKTALFLSRASEQASKHNITVVALVNASTDTKWFADAAKSANEVRLITGRVAFQKADGKTANGNTKGQCIIIWRGNCKTPCNIVMIDRNELVGLK